MTMSRARKRPVGEKLKESREEAARDRRCQLDKNPARKEAAQVQVQ